MLEKLFLTHVLTRDYNPNADRVDWCVCEVAGMEILPPLVFGKTIQEALDNFENLSKEDEQISDQESEQKGE